VWIGGRPEIRPLPKAHGTLVIEALGDAFNPRPEANNLKIFTTICDKVRQGHCVGGRVFGYRNVDIASGVDERSGRPEWAC